MAGVAERLQVVEVVCAAACDVEDVVNFQAFDAAASDAPITVAAENFFTETMRCSA